MINQIHQDYINYKDIVKEHNYILNKQIKSNLLFIKLRNVLNTRSNISITINRLELLTNIKI